MTGKNDFFYNLLTEQDRQRFWSKVQRTHGGCWLWQAGADKDGYGKFAIGKQGNQIHLRAHRVAYCLNIESDIPRFADSAPVVVRHKCDNPRCVNPEHLFLATHQENVADKVAKGRQAKGGRNAKSKLTEWQVREIRARLDAEQTPIEIIRAMNLDVHDTTIYAIKNGDTWRHIA